MSLQVVTRPTETGALSYMVLCDGKPVLDRNNHPRRFSTRQSAQNALVRESNARVRAEQKRAEQAACLAAATVSLEDEADDEPALCLACNGSGEGMADGARCRDCNGHGIDAAPASRPYGRMDPEDRLHAADLRRIGLKAGPTPLSPEQVESAYAARAAHRQQRLEALRANAAPRPINMHCYRPADAAPGARGWE